MEENVQFREAALAAGFNSNSYEEIAKATGYTPLYIKQVRLYGKPLSVPLRNKLTELAYGGSGRIDDGKNHISDVSITTEKNITNDQQRFVSNNYEITPSKQGEWLICRMQWVVIAKAETEENAQKICDALNNS